MITSASIKAGSRAGLLEDDLGTKSAKVYLVLMVGGGDLQGGDIMGVMRGLYGCGRWKEEDRKEEGIG